MANTPEGEQGLESIRDRFSQTAYAVLVRAQDEAKRFNHNYIGTEHQLLGLISGEHGDPAVTVLTNLGINLNNVRSAVEFIIGRREERPIAGEIAPTPYAKKVIDLAVDESKRDFASEVTTLHLLRGLVREGEGIAASVLESLAGNLDRVRREATRVQVAEEKLTPEQESVYKLKSVLENPNISQRTKTFIIGLVDKATEYAAQEDTSELKAE